MRILNVSAAVIIKENRILAVQRSGGGWEFPGGKIEQGETPEEALKREIREELDCIIEIDSFLMKDEYDYESFHLSMDCFLTHIVQGEPVLKEHTAARWLEKEELDEPEWLKADIAVAQKLKEIL